MVPRWATFLPRLTALFDMVAAPRTAWSFWLRQPPAQPLFRLIQTFFETRL